MTGPSCECVVLVPMGNRIYWPCENALRELEKRGYPVWRVPGYSAIDQARNQMSSDALFKGFAEQLWIDSDISFHPDDVDKIRSHATPIVGAVYPKKGSRSLACHLLPDTEFIEFGSDGSLMEIQYAGTGFLLVRRVVYDTIKRVLSLPLCNQRFESPVIPFFQPMVVGTGEDAWYLAEDFSFSERARQAGFAIMVDTSIRLMHIGDYGYSWEDAGADPVRYSRYKYEILDNHRADTRSGDDGA